MAPLTKKNLLDALDPIARDVKLLRAEDEAQYKSIGEHFEKIETRLEDIPTRGELGELFKKFYDAGVISARLERIEKHLGLDIIRVE